MTELSSTNTLIIVALEAELPRKLLPTWRIVYSGVGKINATITLCDAITQYKPRAVVNYGTAGALQDQLVGLYEVTRLFQRDMDATGLGFSLGQTPFEKDISLDLGRPGLSCGTGDQFVTNPSNLKTDLVDMEAYALSKVCKHRNLDFYCYKFVSDNADGKAKIDWNERMAGGAKLFCSQLLQNTC